MDVKKWKLRLWNFWPPLLFSGIRIESLSKDFRHATTKLKLRWWNANFVGTQFGGAIFSMSDAVYMVMLINILGPDYIVWDKGATIRFLKPGRTDLTAEFHITEEDLDFIYTAVAQQGKVDIVKKVNIIDTNGVIVADVNRVLYVKKRS